MSINIKPSHKSRLTRKATAAGQSPIEYAKKMAHNPGASEATRKQSQFAINARHWNHSR